MMRQLLVLALSRLPRLTITEAVNGMDALRKLADERFDIVLTDINMPVMDGLKLVKHLRGDPKHQAIPVIMISTEGTAEDRQRALALGANAYITKPVQAPFVVSKVRELLEL